MLEAPASPPAAPPSPEDAAPGRPGRRAGRPLVLAAVFVCAACGLVYELQLVALASYLIGDSVTQTSVVLAVMVFAMGVGSLLAKRLRRRAAMGFGLLEALLALVGGGSALALHASFAWLDGAWHALVAFCLATGVLIGAEMPLLMTLIQRVSRRARQDADGTVADLFAADYVGALVGGLAFPFVLLPWLGQLTGALLTGAVNAVAGGAIVLWLFARSLTGRERLLLVGVNVAVLGLLAGAALLVEDFERAARHAVYGPHVRVAVHTDVQEVVLTGARHGPPDLYLDGRLRVSGGDGHRYHRALVHPAMRGPRARVLVLGGGDGLAAREVLRYADVVSVTVVEADPGVVRLARADPALARLNGHAYDDPRVRVVHGDAFRWLRTAQRAARYDVVVADLPHPGTAAGAKLYSQEFYGLAARVLADGGRLAVHAGPVAARPSAYWTVEATLRAAGFATRPYAVTGRAAGDPGDAGGEPGGSARSPHDWGLLLAVPASRGRPGPPALAPAAGAPAGDAPTADALAAAARRAERSRVRGLPPSTLTHPRYGR
ncbi:polyamine aminopropyltransferase [Streptomyces sp. DH12]|uniref:polyamine aminopropyltransferase n=1 Tax=Streptomyces sp. DH12 TaxID=2857010 RepID=UPI001E3D405C|nr:polyamine aminopropyltransferase [Streptomyces sp. DH12]